MAKVKKKVVKKKKKSKAKVDLLPLVDGAAQIKGVNSALRELVSMQKEVKRAVNTKLKPTFVLDTIYRTDARAKILKVELDARFRLINKQLPDKKAIQLGDADDKNPFDKFADALKGAVSASSK